MKKIVLILLPLLLCIGSVSAKTFTAVDQSTIHDLEINEEKVRVYDKNEKEKAARVEREREEKQEKEEREKEERVKEERVKEERVKEVVVKEPTPFKERRVDRQINKKKFIYKGELMVGISASYNSLNSDNAEVLTLLTNMNVDGSITSINPYEGYFYRDNRAVGVRYGYVEYSGTINSTTLDLGSSNDLSFDVPYINLSSISNSYSIFHRAYAPLDDRGNFGVFAEVELAATSGHTTFEYESNGAIESSFSKNRSYDLNFNPGIAAFVMRNVCASLSFQFGGLNYTYIRQYNQSNELIGTRESSKMRFKFNVFAVNFGVAVHLW